MSTRRSARGSTDPKWYETNYGIKIQTADEARIWLDKGLGYHKPEDLQDLLDFKPGELPLLEFVLERMSDQILSTFRGLRINRQKVFFDWKDGAFERKERTAGVTRGERASTRTITIFDAATDDPDALFAGGLDPSGKPVWRPDRRCPSRTNSAMPSRSAPACRRRSTSWSPTSTSSRSPGTPRRTRRTSCFPRRSRCTTAILNG